MQSSGGGLHLAGQYAKLSPPCPAYGFRGMGCMSTTIFTRKTLASPRQGVRSIMLVDDQHNLALAVGKLLQEWFRQFELLHFENGDDAWEELRQVEPDLLITDWQHPGMDGAEIVARLAKRQAKFPVLMISAHKRADFEKIDSTGLKIRYLKKTGFMREEFFRALKDFVGPSDFPQLQDQI